MELDLMTIDQLTCQEVAGVLSAAEKAQLDELIAGDEKALMFYQKRLAYYQSDEVKAFVHDQQKTEMGVWAKIENKRVIFRRRYLTAAAAIFLLSIGGFIYLLLPNRLQPTELAGNQAGPTAITLQMPSGNTIDLSSTNGQVTTGNTTLQNSNKTLSYTSNNGGSASGLAILRVPVGKDYKLELADGSEIWLNSATTVKFPFSFAGTREITISGEAYIKVAPDPGKPFVVHLPGSTVQVLGTEFNVNTYDSSSSVALVKGAVKFVGPGSAQLIKPGYAITMTKDGETSITTFDPDLTLSWRKGIFYFDDVSLQEICRVLPRWFGVEVVMDNPAIANNKFSGKLNRDRPLEKQLDLFTQVAGINYYFKGDVLHFK